MIEFLSLGEACVTAYQIRRFNSSDDAFFYDWLATTGGSFKGIFIDQSEFLKSQNWEIVDGGDRLLDKATQIRFRHEFPVNDPVIHHVDPDMVEQHLPLAKEKFLYLKEKTIKKIELTKNICIICFTEESSYDYIDSKKKEIFNQFKSINPNIKLIFASTGMIEEKIEDEFILLRVSKGNDWMGDDASWDRLFNIANMKF
jgi:hypothetical protein